jgi:hypothetical protein
MTNVERLYEQAIKPLSAADRLRLAAIILREIPPEYVVDYSDAWTDQDQHEFTAATWRHAGRSLGEEDA